MHSIYIESADEITTVIERLREAPDGAVALVAPKGAGLLQSVVNLKLARKAARDAGKDIVIVTTDPIGKNLCTQLGIPVAATEKAAEGALAGDTETPDPDVKVIAGVRVHNYYDEEKDTKTNDDDDAPEPIIIPKNLLKEEAPAPEAPIEVPEPAGEAVAEPAVAAASLAAPALTRSKLAREDIATSPDPAPETMSTTKAAQPPRVPRVPREKQPMTKGQRRVLLFTLYLSAVGALAIIAIAFLFLPFTRIELAVSATDWEKDLAITASTQSDASETYLKAERVNATVEQAYTYPATGSKDVGEKATGTVTLYNYDSTSAVTVPSGTRIVSGTRAFTTTAATTVPGFTQAGGGLPRVPGKGTAAIVAEIAGPDSNLTDASANDIKVNGVTLSSNTVTSSGGTSKTITIVSNEDITKAKEELTKQLTAAAQAKLQSDLAPRGDMTYKDGADTIELGEVTYSTAAGTEAASGEAKASLTLSRTVVTTTSIKQRVEALLKTEQLADHTYKITDETITVSTVSGDATELAISVHVKGKEASVVPQEDLAQALSGKTLAAGETIITNTVPGSTIKLRQSPSWWPVHRYPTLNRYITITVTYE